MIQASRSPSSATPPRTLGAGPLLIEIAADDGPLRELIVSTLSLFDAPWSLSNPKIVRLAVAVTGRPVPTRAAGSYLECAQMLVDALPFGLRATTTRGASLAGRFDEDSESWLMEVPETLIAGGWWPEIEDLVSLVLTTGWRRAGWVPLHAAGLARPGRGVVVCASGGGGKTTFSVAMVRRGWQMLGDDKLLLGTVAGRPALAALKHMLNLDPAVARWFPEVGDLSRLPEYSVWSPKRRVALAAFWPAAAAHSMTPTHLVQLVRRRDRRATSISVLEQADTLAALMRQSVIPRQPDAARRIVGALAGLGRSVVGYRLELGEAAYENPAALDGIDEALG